MSTTCGQQHNDLRLGRLNCSKMVYSRQRCSTARRSTLRCFLFKVLLGAVFFLLCPLPIKAEISYSTQYYDETIPNPPPSSEVMEMVKTALKDLADDPRLINYPVRHYYYDSDFPIKIVFDNPGTVVGAKVVNFNEIHISSDKDFSYYLMNLAHEFLHISMAEKYGDTHNFTFLPPADFAFLHLMEESFANTLGLWVYLNYPEIQNNYEINGWERQNNYINIADAMRNDFLPEYPEHEEEVMKRIYSELFNLYMINANAYNLVEVPRNMAIVYGRKNTFLIPEYKAYGEYSEVILKHVWDYLSQIMPFQLATNRPFDHYRMMFTAWIRMWSSFPTGPDGSIYYWVHFDAEAAAMKRLAVLPPDKRFYDFLPPEYEDRLNRVILEIDPDFDPVDTSKNPHRLQ